MATKPTPNIFEQAAGPSAHDDSLISAVLGNHQQLDPRVIDTTGGTQMRAVLDLVTIADYATIMKEAGGWGPFPAAIVYYDGSTYWAADCFHRLAAFREAGFWLTQRVPAEIRAGTRRDAILFAAGANSSHGLRRTNADKRRAVEALLRDPEWATWSDREIARRCAVGNAFVHNVRQELSVHGEQIDHRTVTRGGTTYTQNTARIGFNRPPAAPAHPSDLSNPSNTPAGTIAASDADHHVILGATAAGDPRHTRRADPPTSQPAIVDVLNPSDPPNPSDPSLPRAYHIGALNHRPPDVTVYCADSRALGMPDQPDLWPHPPIARPVDLVITSPPYNVGIAYNSHDDALPIEDYIRLLDRVFTHCYDHLAPSGRICVVVPFGVGRNPWQPLAYPVTLALSRARFTLRGQIIWDKGSSGNRTTWGSWRSFTNPSLRDTCEAILVAHKDDPQAQNYPDGALVHDGEHSGVSPWLPADLFMELTQDHWTVAPESATRIGHPAPFPVQLAERLLRLYGWPGCHVLDPFAGSGTVGIAAIKLGAIATLVDIDPIYCSLAARRLDAAANGKAQLDIFPSHADQPVQRNGRPVETIPTSLFHAGQPVEPPTPRVGEGQGVRAQL